VLKSSRAARLRQAAIDDDVAQIAKVVRRRGIDDRDAKGRTALYLAASRSNAEIVRLLLDAGADPNAICVNGQTPYYAALSSPFSSSEVIATLQRFGAVADGMVDVARTDRFRRTPLHYAASDRNPGRRDLIAALLSSGADVGARDCAAFTPLHFAAGGDDVEVARMLLDAGAEVDAKDVDGDTPLIVATRRSSAAEPMIALLREHGADPLLVNKKGWSALLLARRDVIGGNTEQVKRAFADLPDPPPRIQPPPPAPVSSVRDALNRLRDEGIRNGNLNWEVGNYAALAEHVRANLDDPTLFDEVELRQLRTDFAHLADPEWLGTFGPSHDWGDQEFGRLLAATERWEATRSAR